MTGLVTELDPSTEQGRQWLADELAKSEYNDTRSLFQRVMSWIAERLADLQNTQGTGGTSLPPFVIALVVLVLAVGVGYLLTRIRVESKTVTERKSLLGDSNLTAEQLRREAERALAEQRYAEAVVAWTRALARDAELRTLLPNAPSMTAHEVGATLVPVFPKYAERIAPVMDRFDAVEYGEQAATREDAVAARDLDAALHSARPTLLSGRRRTDAGAPPAGGAPPPPSGPPVSAGSGAGSGSDGDSVWLTGVRP